MCIISFPTRSQTTRVARQLLIFFSDSHQVVADHEYEITKPIASVCNAPSEQSVLVVKRRPISSDANRTEDPK